MHIRMALKKVTFTVTDTPGPAILWCKTCEELDLINVKCSLEANEEKLKYSPLSNESLISDLLGPRNFSHEIISHSVEP